MRAARRTLLVLGIAALLGCGAPPVDRSALPAVPHPTTDNLNPATRQQLADERQVLDSALAAAAPTAVELAAAFGRMGMHYHAYDLHAVARVCYENAAGLAPEVPRWPYLLGVLDQAEGREEAASHRFEQVLENRGDDPAALLRLAEARLRLDQAAVAERHFRRVLELDTGSAAALVGLGRLASARGDHAAAAAHLEQALEIQPQAYDANYLLGMAYRRLGKSEAAEGLLTRFESSEIVTFADPLLEEVEGLVVGVGPPLLRALEALGEDRYDLAAQEYRAALAIEPQNPTALQGLGLALRRTGDLEGAAEHFAKMLQADPDHGLARVELATVQMEMGAFEEAVAGFELAISRDPSFREAHLNLGVTLSRAGRWPEAAARFEGLLEVDEHDLQARYYLALANHELGRTAEARAQLERVVAADPSFFLARQRLGHLLAEQGDSEGAAVQHRAVLELEAPPQEKALAHFQLGAIATRQGSPLEATGHYQEASALFPGFWQAEMGLGSALRTLGRHGEAAAAYRRVLEIDAGNLPAWVGEAETLLLAGRYREAHLRLEEGLVRLPQSAELGHLLARLLAAAPLTELRDGERGLQLASGIFNAYPTLEHAETVVMAMAELGRFAEAVEWQRKIITRAQNEGKADHLPRLRANLERYRRGEPARGF